MNYSTAVFLINDKVRAVYGVYQPIELLPHQSKTLFKTLDPDLKVGDYVLVPTTTRHKMTVFRLTDVDVDFDIETPAKIDWIIGKVDYAAYDQLFVQEQDAIKIIQSAEKTRKREALREAMLKDSEAKLTGLPIAAIGHDPE